MPPSLSSLVSRTRRNQAQEISAALQGEVHRQREVIDAHDRLSVLCTALADLEMRVNRARRTGKPHAGLLAELKRRQQLVGTAQQAYERTVEQAAQEIWARYREAIERGQPWESILTPIKRLGGHARPIVLEPEVKEETAPSGPVPGRAWGMGMKR